MTRWLWTGLLCLLCAGNALATLYAVPASWNFGSVETGHEEMRWVMIAQNGPEPVEVSGIVTGTGFSAILPIHFILQPGDSGIFVAVVFNPPEPGVYTGTLQLFTTDPARPDLVVSLMGEGMLAPMDPFILLDFPRDDEWIAELPITFQWELLEGPGDTTASFTLWIRALTPDSNSLPVLYSTGTATSYVLNDPSYGEGRYLWWVTAVWSGGVLQSPMRLLQIGELPPPPPVFELLSPENEATITLPNGTFVWSTLPYPNVPAQACVYQLWVIPADSVNGDDVPLSVSTADTTVTVDLSAFEGQDRCFWFVIAHLSNGVDVGTNSMRSFHVSGAQQPAAVDESQAHVATAFGIASAAPNPFNPETRITLTVPLAGQVTADVFDVLGRHVATLVDGPLAAGEHTLTWRPHGPAGLYLLRVQDARGASDVRKLFFIK